MTSGKDLLENLKAEAALARSVLTTRYWAEREMLGRGRAASALIALRASLGSVADTMRFREW